MLYDILTKKVTDYYRFDSFGPMYYRNTHAAIVVYDITNSESFNQAKRWVKELHRFSSMDMVIGLAGNKSDLIVDNKKKVDTREVANYAEENGLIFMETSAKRGDNVTEIFMTIAEQVAGGQPINTFNEQNDAFTLTKSKSNKNSSCCGGNKS